MSEEHTNPEEHSAENQTPRQDISWGKTIVSIIVILGVAGLLTFFYYKKHKTQNDSTTGTSQQTTSQTPPPPAVEIAEPEQITPPPPVVTETPPPVVQTPPPPVSPTPTITPPVTPLPIRGTPPPAPKPVTKTFYYKNFGFSFQGKNTWSGTEESNIVTVKDTLTGSTVGVVQTQIQGPSDSLDTLWQQINRSPEARNLQKVTVHGLDAIQYTRANSYGVYTVMVKNGKIFYITDLTARTTITSSFAVL